MEILVLTTADALAHPLPALGLLPHTVRTELSLVPVVVAADRPDLVLVDARTELADAKATVQILKAAGAGCPVLAVVAEGGLAAVDADWGVDDIVLTTAGPAEIEARLRFAGTRGPAALPGVIRAGRLAIHPDGHTALLDLEPLDLTHKEFQLLHFLLRHPGRVFTRDQLLRGVWGIAYFGGPRTVDVHIRRLRVKLGADHAALIRTVRQVGYTFAWSGLHQAHDDADVDRPASAHRAAGTPGVVRHASVSSRRIPAPVSSRASGALVHRTPSVR